MEFVPAPEGSAGLPARIIARSFAGGQIHFTALLRNGEEVSACHQGIDSSLQNGMEVRACWASENAIPVVDTEDKKEIAPR